jgi:hypothetical protein
MWGELNVGTEIFQLVFLKAEVPISWVSWIEHYPVAAS